MNREAAIFHPEVGRPFGPYLIEARLAEGGMAGVWRARYGEEAEPVALKTMLPHLARRPDCVTMFTREAYLGARFDHPNIVPVHDVGSVAGCHYIEMPYVDGYNLRQIIRHHRRARRPVPLAFALAVASDLADALTYIHDFPGEGAEPEGLVHRDVSPENVMVGLDGRARLMDFGVATSELSGLTRTGQLKGKLHYMAAEVFRGHSASPGRDIFAAAATVYEVLTGERPFRADTEAEVMYRISHGGAASARGRRADIPETIDDLLSRNLRPEPEGRGTTHAFGEIVRGCLANVDSRTPQTIIEEAMRAWAGQPGWEVESSLGPEPDDARSVTSGMIMPRSIFPSARGGREGRSSGSLRDSTHTRGASSARTLWGSSPEPSRWGGLSSSPRSALSQSKDPTGRSGWRRASVEGGSATGAEPASRRKSVEEGAAASVFTSSRWSRAASSDSSVFALYVRAPEPPPEVAEPDPDPDSEPAAASSARIAAAAQHFERGLEYKRRGELEATLGQWQRAAELDPDNPSFATNVRLMRKMLRR